MRAIQKLAPETVKLSAERVQQELTMIFTGENPDLALDMLHETGLLAVLLPEIEAMRGVAQPPQFHPEGDVYEHTRLMLKAMALPNELIAWSVLLHDVAKPLTYFVDETGRIRFFGHEQRGARMAKKIMSRLRFSKNAIDRVSRAVKNHMRFASVLKMRKDKVRRLLVRRQFSAGTGTASPGLYFQSCLAGCFHLSTGQNSGTVRRSETPAAVTERPGI